MAHREVLQVPHDPPSQHVQEEAGKIISLLDGPKTGSDSRQDLQGAKDARDLLLKDVHSMSGNDTRDLLFAIMTKETKYQGYDLELFGHSKEDQDKFNEETRRECAILGKIQQYATPKQLQDAEDNLRKSRAEEFVRYQHEMTIELLRERKATPEEQKKGYGIIYTDGIEVAKYHPDKDGLPDLQVVGGK